MSVGLERHFWLSVARGSAGAIVFCFPLLMTMEMWWLGFTISPPRLVLLVIFTTPLLALLSYYSGFDEHHSVPEAILDAFVAWIIGLVIAFVMLALLGIIHPGLPLPEIIGKCLLQAVPASIGAVLTGSILGIAGGGEERKHHPGQFRELVLRIIGALFLAFTAAPTEEMVLISYRMSKLQSVGLMLLSLALVHAFVSAAEHRRSVAGQRNRWEKLFRSSMPAYAVAFVVSAYILWTFGRLEGMAVPQMIQAVVVLAFPAALGAGAVRLIL